MSDDDRRPLIVVDSSELRSNSKSLEAFQLSDLEITEVGWLEELTGADMMITAFRDMPVVPPTLKFHIESRKAVLFQIKWGNDLIASIPDGRLVFELSRMNETSAFHWQKVLLPVGYYFRNNDENVMTGRRMLAQNPTIYWTESTPRCNWKALETSLRRWALRGGTVLSNVTDQNDFINVIRDYCVDLMELKPVTELWNPIELLSEPEHPLQSAIRVTDGRLMISAIPGIGPKLVNNLSHEISKKAGDTTGISSAAEMLDWIGRLPGFHYKIPGWGDKTIENSRRWIGLKDNQTLALIEHSEEEIQSVLSLEAKNDSIG